MTTPADRPRRKKIYHQVSKKLDDNTQCPETLIYNEKDKRSVVNNLIDLKELFLL